MPDPLLVVVVVFALAFAVSNGFHDASNAVATSVATRAVTPAAGLALAAFFNLVGAFLGLRIAQVYVDGVISAPVGPDGLVVVLAALLGAITWNAVTWWRGLPSSSSHALVGGLLGAGAVSASTVRWGDLFELVVVPMLLSPLLGFLAAHLVMAGVLRGLRHATRTTADRRFRMAQPVSAAAVALGHGMQDAPKTMGVIVLALLAAGGSPRGVPLWVVVASAVAIALGTLAGGFRIMRTLGRRVVDLDPPRGFTAEAVTASLLWTAGLAVAAPVSTTHITTGALVGVGSVQRRAAVRWRVVREIAVGWVATVPSAALVAVLSWVVLDAALR